jgi:uncharacterized iron-regulated membrane protein
MAPGNNRMPKEHSMKKLLVLLSFFSASLVAATAAHAHPGHVGPLSGHSHWLALGAGIIALAIAGLYVFLGKRNKMRSGAKSAARDESANNKVRH